MTSLEFSNTTCTFRTLASSLRDDTISFRLTNVRIEGTENDMQLLFKSARGHPTLEIFHVNNVTTVDPSVTLDLILSSLLVSAPRIHTVHVENTAIRASTIATIGYSDSIKTVSLPKNGYTDTDASIIAEALVSSPSLSLHSVDFSGNELSDLGGQYLERFLEKNKGIVTLRLDGNKNMSRDGYAKVSAILVGRTASAA
ncbi:hypothetical protein ACA910_014052 [Epithemia clementina (nom. ined.)]